MESARADAPDPTPPRIAAGVGPSRPLSFTQQRLWWFGQVVASSSNVVMAMRMRGPLAFHALEQALQVTVARHSLLRTRFRVEDGGPVQEVLSGVSLALTVVDLQGLSADQRASVVQRVLAEDAARPFDLSCAPLLRPRLFRLDARDHVFAATIDHMLIDDRSRHLLSQEIGERYTVFSAGAPAAFTLPPAEYGDFALWERQQFSGPATEKHLRFWREYLADLPALLELPVDHPRPARRTYAGIWRTRDLPAPVGDQVRALALAEGATPFQFLLATFAVLLARQSRSKDIAVGTPFVHRPHVDYERVIGPFLHSVVVRMNCSGSPSFRSFVRHVRKQAIAALARGQVPFEMIVDALRPDRDASYNPLVQVWFIYKAATVAPPAGAWQGPEVSPIDLQAGASPFDVTFSIAEHEGGLNCSCQGNAALYEPRTLDRLLDQWERLLLAVLRDPDGCIDAYDLLSPEEYHQQIVAWNATAITWPVAECVHDAVAAVVERCPDSVAVSMNERHLTYAELQLAAEALGERLWEAGVRVDGCVAVFMDRSPDLVVALLGVLRAGGAYVPLDITAPKERLATLLRDARAACVVTTLALRERIPDLGLPLVVLDPAPPHGAPASARRATPRARASGDNLCYVIYTSGTTGEPKGVAVSHAAAMNLLCHMSRALGITPASTLLAISPITFDISVLEVFAPLLAGAHLILAPAHSSADGADLRARLEAERIAILQATPATWRLLMDTGWQAPPGFQALSGGETLPEELARQLVDRVGRVLNYYGPTETIIYSTGTLLTSTDEAVTIGRPIANTSVYLLDDNLRPVPLGVPAQVHIGGVGLARGYVGRPSQTAEAYRPDPFSDQPGSRMYATGDVARYLEDGRLDYRGRYDHQVKLHGRRIELEAIAHVTGAHPLVHECVTVVRRDAHHGEFLAAYVVMTQPGELPRADLREHLARQLPPYMIPSAVVVLDALPRTRHGKIDRKALPAPTEADFRAAAAPVRPRTPLEERIAAVWREVLELSEVGAEDNFFALGGTSLNATRVLLLIRDALGVSISLPTFFDAPTVAGLAGQVSHLGPWSGVRSDETVPHVPRDGTLQLAPQQANWWRNEHFTGHINPSNIHLGVRMTGPLQAMALEQVLAALQRRHEGLRTAYVSHDRGGAVPIVTPAEDCHPRLSIVDLSQLAPGAREAVVPRLCAAEQSRPFDLTRGHLLRATLVRLGPEDHLALFTTHHLVSDGWSIEVLMTEFSTLYAAMTAGQPARLPPLRFQYADFAHWQRSWLAGPGAAAQLDYWRRQLAPPLPPLLPPAGRAADFDTPYFSLRGRVPLAISAPATEAARRLARGEHCTLFSVLLAGLKLALVAHTGAPEVRVATLAANRTLPGAEQVVGLFTNVVCLRTRVAPTLPFAGLIRAVHATIADAAAHQDLPFEFLASVLENEQGTPLGSLFQALVLWQPIPAVRLAVAEVQTSLYRLEEEQFGVVMVRNTLDLKFELREMPETVSGAITYQMARFTPAQIRGLVDALDRCLTLADRDPSLTVASLCDLLRQPARADATSGARA
jgi:amino acid adenylation domain-containing protein